MDSMKESEFLSRLMECAQQLVKEHRCNAVTRDFILAAACHLLKNPEMAGQENAEEQHAVLLVLIRHTGKQREELESMESFLVNAWAGKSVPSSEIVLLMALKGKAKDRVRAVNGKNLTADVLLDVLLTDKTDAIRAMMGEEKPAPAAVFPWMKKQEETAATQSDDEPAQEPKQASQPEETMNDMTMKVKKLQKQLSEKVMGQSHAVSTFVTGYFQSELQAAIDRTRKTPRATFLFAGPPGVGKTFLSETVAECLGLPFRRFDMSEYTGPNAADELSGSDANYKASSEGQLTGFVSKNPHCVLLFDEIEKASMETLHLFLQVLDAGRLRDNRTDKEVSFRDAICIFTTNAGRGLYENSQSANLSSLSRDVIVDGISKDINPRTREPYFPAALCSRFASGNVVMFNHLDAMALNQIAQKRLEHHFDNMKNTAATKMEMDENLSTALLLAEGASADARSVKSRADAFFGGELFELFRLVPSGRQVNEIQTIRFSVDLDNASEEIRNLFIPQSRVHAMVFSARRLPLNEKDATLPLFHYVNRVEDAWQLMKEEEIKFLVCDLMTERNAQAVAYLNKEDAASPGREFLYSILEKNPDMPVLLMESSGCRYTEEEKDSFRRRGIWGFVDVDTEQEKTEETVRRAADVIFRQHSLTRLARANRLIHFETAQCLLDDGKEAEIVLFDLKLQKAVKAEDSGNVMSMLSTPEEKFDDVIGADDAKEELRFFANCLKDPRKYTRRGAAAPKGVLLWGPPGTGKTMLAKAFANESGATFIATEGNRFFTGVVGQGAEMVHRLFATARRYAPAVLFIDEVDVIAKARTGRDTDMANDSEQILTALFAEMDGFSTDPSRQVFVLGATNYSVEADAQMKLDPAFLRRFDRRILVDLPDVKDRRRFLEKEMERRPYFSVSRQGIDSLADRSGGMSLAQLKSVLEMAMRQGMRQDAEKVDDKLLEETYETFVNGEKREWKPEIMLRTARHEAGHALISYRSGDKPSYLTVVSRGNYGGYMQHGNQEDKMTFTRQELLARIRTALGGRAAEIVYYGNEEGLSTGASGDLATATNIARHILCTYGMDEQFGMGVIAGQHTAHEDTIRQAVNTMLREQLALAVEIIRKNRVAFDRLVDELVKHGNLREKDIDNILQNVL